MKDKVYYIIPVLHVLIIVYSSSFFITETNDSRDYYSIAENLPTITNSLFPILYPTFLKLFNTIFDNFFITSKVFNVICILLSLVISRKFLKEWKIFWIFTMTWGFMPIVTYSWSEILLIPLTLLLFVNFRNLFNKQESAHVNITVLLVLLFLTKYSLISVSIATLGISLIAYFKTREKEYKQLAISTMVSIVVCSVYLGCNYYFTGFLTGNRAALGPVKTNLRLSLFNTLQSFNPLFSNFFGRTPYVVVVLLTIILFFVFYKRIKLIFAHHIKANILFIFLGLFYLLFLWATYFFIKIDVLSIRLLFPFYLMFFMGLFINPIKIKNFNLIVILISLNLLILFVGSFYNLHNYF